MHEYIYRNKIDKIMKRILLLIPVLCLVLCSCAQNTEGKIDSLVSAYANMHEFNGSVLVAKGGKLLINKGYGFRNVADKVPNTEQSIFQLGSITKQFTAAV